MIFRRQLYAWCERNFRASICNIELWLSRRWTWIDEISETILTKILQSNEILHAIKNILPYYPNNLTMTSIIIWNNFVAKKRIPFRNYSIHAHQPCRKQTRRKLCCTGTILIGGLPDTRTLLIGPSVATPG